MSPRFYSLLWILFVASAGLFWLFGAMSMLVVVVYGFIAFGLIFAGMMCVLPGVVAHPAVKTSEVSMSTTNATKQVARDVDPSMASVHFPLNPKFH